MFHWVLNTPLTIVQPMDFIGLMKRGIKHTCLSRDQELVRSYSSAIQPSLFIIGPAGLVKVKIKLFVAFRRPSCGEVIIMYKIRLVHVDLSTLGCVNTFIVKDITVNIKVNIMNNP